MQIIAGQFKGRKIQTLPGLASRPTLSRIREALFNILAPVIRDAYFIDFYAGAGSIGLEALSRGCRKVVFVETDRSIVPVLQANIRKLDPEGGKTECLARDAFAAAGMLAQRNDPADIAFLDPPYGQNAAAAWAGRGHLDTLVSPQGRIILQHGLKDAVPETLGGLAVADTRRYGATMLTFYGNAGQGRRIPEGA